MPKVLIRKLLKDQIKTIYKTQDRCAYELGINNGTLNRIINCTLDPNAEQMDKLCNYLNLTKKEVNKKHEQ